MFIKNRLSKKQIPKQSLLAANEKEKQLLKWNEMKLIFQNVKFRVRKLYD